MMVNKMKRPTLVEFSLLEGEKSKEVPNTEGLYVVTSFGRVWRYCKRKRKFKENFGRWLSCSINNHGYVRLDSSINSIKKNYAVHRLVAEAFVPNPESKPEVNHIDGNKLNNRSDNLEWVTRIENVKHAIDTGLMDNNGVKCNLTKLSDETITLILKDLSVGDSARSVADRYSITPTYVRQLRRGLWRKKVHG